ncbi:hypothetical protein KEM52_001518 [Ascosphaera acerosa]|nr:hypothetical protein KEM52_001518 [Ascosphaera acerosa]
MDAHLLFASRQELSAIEEEVKQLYAAQLNHAERLARLERRKTQLHDDAGATAAAVKMKSVWGSPLSPLAPFVSGLGSAVAPAPAPAAASGSVGSGVLGGEVESQSAAGSSRAGTPAATVGAEAFKGFSVGAGAGLEHASVFVRQHPADGAVTTATEPRRATASRANSVRFDEASLQQQQQQQQQQQPQPSSPGFPPFGGSYFSPQPPPARSLTDIAQSAGSRFAFGSSAGSGKAGLAGLTTGGSGGGGGLPPSITTMSLDGTLSASTSTPLGPPPGLAFLGPVPSIVRCWLTADFSSDALLYAAVCSGSYHSTIGLSLVRRLGLEGSIVVDPSDTGRTPPAVGGAEILAKKHHLRPRTATRSIKLPVYLPEASLCSASSRAGTPALQQQLPAITVYFSVREDDDAHDEQDGAAIQVILGSDVLRAHNADILLSQDRVVLVDDERNRVSVPLSRPEDVAVYNLLSTAPSGLPPSRPREVKAEETADSNAAVTVAGIGDADADAMSAGVAISCADKSPAHTSGVPPTNPPLVSQYNGSSASAPATAAAAVTTLPLRDFSDLARASRPSREGAASATAPVSASASASTASPRYPRPSLSSRPSLESIETGSSAPTWPRGRQLSVSSQEASAHVNGSGSASATAAAHQHESTRPRSERSWYASSSTRDRDRNRRASSGYYDAASGESADACGRGSAAVSTSIITSPLTGSKTPTSAASTPTVPISALASWRRDVVAAAPRPAQTTPAPTGSTALAMSPSMPAATAVSTESHTAAAPANHAAPAPTAASTTSASSTIAATGSPVIRSKSTVELASIVRRSGSGSGTGSGPATRPGRQLKVLKPKTASVATTATTRRPFSSSAMTAAPPLDPERDDSALSMPAAGSTAAAASSPRWIRDRDAGRSPAATSTVSVKSPVSDHFPALKLVTNKLRSSANPVGGASAFGWLNNNSGGAGAK